MTNPYCNCGHMNRNHADDGMGECRMMTHHPDSPSEKCSCEQFHNNEIKILKEAPESILVQKARYELEGRDLAGKEFPDFDEKIIEIVRIFASMGHSGSSASFTRGVIDKLLRQQALTPLTDDPAEWEEHDASKWDGKNQIWQNRRDSRALSTDGGRTYFLVSEVKGETKIYNSEWSINGPNGDHVRELQSLRSVGDQISPPYDR